MNRIAIFAHYDRDGLIDDYVLYYLRGLRAVAARILFVSDCALAPGEAGKLDGLAELVSAARHGGYDFGSWQRGLAQLGDGIAAYDEMILANDSCYAPIFPLEDVFTRMAAVACDAWGPTGYGNHHDVAFLNSYFLVFRRPVLGDPRFTDFWSRIVPRKDKQDVVGDYEMGLSRMLLAGGYKLGSLVPPDPVDLPIHDDYLRRLMRVHGSSWLKVRLFSENPIRVPRLDKAMAGLDRHYPRRLIDAHLRRLIGTDDPRHYHFRLGSFRWLPGDGRLLRVFARIRRDRWWKLYVHLFGVPVFAFVLPLARRDGDGRTRSQPR